MNTTIKGTLIKAETDLDGAYVTPDVDNDISIYRMVQELVNNIVKHAQPTAIQISSQVEQDVFKIVLHHDGKGLSQRQFEELRYKKDGLGLKNIQNRIILIRGKIQFNSEPGNSSIHLVIPYKKSQA